MDPKKLSLRLKPRGKTTGRESAEDRQLAPMMRALKAIHSVGTPDSMNPEDLAKQRAAQEVLGRLVAPHDCHEEVGDLPPKRDGLRLGKAGLAPRQAAGDPLLSRRGIYQWKPGLLPPTGIKTHQCHRLGDPVL